jgi:nitrous oxide reductase accessory protein NosL
VEVVEVMTINTKVLLSFLVSTFLLLAGCSESDKGSASAPAAMPEAPAAESMQEEAMAAEESSGDIEKAEGVVYQDEIYANWPYN